MTYSFLAVSGEATKESGDVNDDDDDIPELDGGSSMAMERMDELADLDGMAVGE